MQFKWTDIDKVSFEDIKTLIAHAPSLGSPNFENDFILYTFALDNSLATILTQKGELGNEYLISFMRAGLQGAKLNYPVIDKQAYEVFKALKQFRSYILNNRTKFVIPHSVVRSLFV